LGGIRTIFVTFDFFAAIRIKALKINKTKVQLPCFFRGIGPILRGFDRVFVSLEKTMLAKPHNF
jgi:hypothetical protein